MDKSSINTFIRGMNRDVDKSVLAKDSYLESKNFRIVTSKGSSSAAKENVEGNKLINDTFLTSTDSILVGSTYLVVKESVSYAAITYSVGDTFVGVFGTPNFTGSGKVLSLSASKMFPDNQYICGAIRLRDYIVVFTTTNTGVPVHGTGRNMIWKLILDKENETITSLTLLYDDFLNAGAGSDTLDFSLENRIKAVSRYETPNIQKVYWTDNYNTLRYLDVVKNLTITGSPYTVNDYMSTTMFEFLPLFNSSKPTLSDVVSGSIQTGVVQYAYQLYRANGAETAMSAVSDVIHVVSDNDFKPNTIYYKGDAEQVNSGKGFVISIDNTGNNGYDRLRLIRLHYPSLNSIPTISISNEIEINVIGSVITITDIGETLGQLTIDEFNIASTDLFKCEDIAIKDNILFASNIEMSTYDIDFDFRAVRFNKLGTVEIPHVDVVSSGAYLHPNGIDINFTRQSDATIRVTISNMNTRCGLSGLDHINDISTVEFLMPNPADVVIDGLYTDTHSSTLIYSATKSQVSVTPLGAFYYDSGTDTLTFDVTTSGSFFTDFFNFENGTLYAISWTYTWHEVQAVTPTARLDDSNPMNNIVLSDLSPTSWASYTEEHDGINVFNNTDNDIDPLLAYKYQSDGLTLGAEGPNVKISFATETIYIDSTHGVAYTYGASSTGSTDASYASFASPFKSGKLSWQRDEVYRLAAVATNTRGQRSYPKWMCDLRMPSLHEAGYDVLAEYDTLSGMTASHVLFPVIEFKSLPADIASVQIYRVKRERSDRFVVTQGILQPTKEIGLGQLVVDRIIEDNDSSLGVTKLLSPEILINKNIAKQANDYLEYVTNYDSNFFSSTNAKWGLYKCHTNNNVPFVLDTRTDISESMLISPMIDSVSIGGEDYINYSFLLSIGGHALTHGAYGSSGLLLKYDNLSWSVDSSSYCIVNYKSNVYGSQYGGHTYEARGLNIYLPCSDIITTTGTSNEIRGGDTYIGYFDIVDLIYDLSTNVDDDYLSFHESVYVPLESSINTALIHSQSSPHRAWVEETGTTDTNNIRLTQEYAGTHVLVIGGTDVEYIQPDDLYLYNTVYSQQSTAQYVIGEMLDSSRETVFDTMIKASNIKSNGELSDSWTKFGINEYIEVDGNFGEVRALSLVGNKLLYWQEDAFGILSVNERSLIQDSQTSSLVLGTGGILDRYDYISTKIGILDKFAMVNADNSVYWFYDKDYSLYRFSDRVDNLTKSKSMWSWFKNNYSSDYIVHGVNDIRYNEVIFTLYNPTTQDGYTVSFNEQTDAFDTLYDFVPHLYIDYKDGYLSTKPFLDINKSLVFFHNSTINPRCRFYSILEASDSDIDNTYPSTIKLLQNEDYVATKVFDNIFYISNAYSKSGDYDLYKITFDSLRCYNDYQNTGWVTLTYDNNIMRRERGWTMAIPRNMVTSQYTETVDIFSPLNIDNTGTKDYAERIRDKYIVVDLSFDNSSQARFVVPFIGIKYRISYR